MKINWNGKIAIVTGASGGIGAAIAEKLASQGLVVILVARRLNKLEELAQKINKAGGIAYPYQADLTSSTQRIGLVDQICRKFGTPSILINNAGLGWYGYFYQMPWPVAKELISLNIESTTHLTSLLISKMQTLDAARIINIRSIAGKLPEQGIAVYSASKAYLDS